MARRSTAGRSARRRAERLAQRRECRQGEDGDLHFLIPVECAQQQGHLICLLGPHQQSQLWPAEQQHTSNPGGCSKELATATAARPILFMPKVTTGSMGT